MAAVAVSAMLIGSLSDMEGVARGIRMGRLIAGMRHSVGTSSEENRRTLINDIAQAPD
jgi:hypothetical protein